MAASGLFRVGITRDFIRPNGELGFGGAGVRLLEQTPGIEVTFLPEHGKELRPEDIAGFDALGVLGPRVTPATLEGNERLALVARFGVGYDNIDIPACTACGVFLTITPEAVQRPMAVVNLTFILALAGRLMEQDKLTREGRWADKQDARGTGLVGKTLGTIGFRPHRPGDAPDRQAAGDAPHRIRPVCAADGGRGRRGRVLSTSTHWCANRTFWSWPRRTRRKRGTSSTPSGWR